MAWYIGVNLGERLDQVVSSASTTGKDVEIVISTTAQGRTGAQSLDLEDLLLLIGRIEAAALEEGRAW
jgi:hypothetical protein